MRRALLVMCLVLGSAATAAADEPVGYALIVGSNAPGPGQQELAWAEEDAGEVAALLQEMGGFRPGNVRVLLAPTPAVLLSEIERMEREIVMSGHPAKVFFYYSGHAKASGLSLGKAELPLAELRARLLDVPSKLTLVVLDACQSGAFSRAKGAEPAADFSFNSKSGLDATGVAVLASSTGSELSQESDFLRSSYFTHHLLVGLRGAADDNDDGRVSLDEAYRYTYHHTLTATAATAVGSQHVSVEVDLKGQGEIPLSYPQKATTTITLPAKTEGQVLVERMPARAVVAELHKAAGTALAIAVAPGTYQVLVRDDDRLWRCQAAPGRAPVTIDLAGCTSEALAVNATKGTWYEPSWHLSIVAGVGGSRQDAYIQRLEDFGFKRQGIGNGQLGVHLARHVHPNVLVGGEAMLLGGEEWSRSSGGAMPLVFSWRTWTIGAMGRVEVGNRRIALYGQLGAGFAVATTNFRDELDQNERENYPGIYGGAAVGLDLWWTRHWGGTLRLSGSYAPAIDNLIGDQHDGGLITLGLGAVRR
jgi:hypothetical protein